MGVNDGKPKKIDPLLMLIYRSDVAILSLCLVKLNNKLNTIEICSKS